MSGIHNGTERQGNIGGFGMESGPIPGPACHEYTIPGIQCSIRFHDDLRKIHRPNGHVEE